MSKVFYLSRGTCSVIWHTIEKLVWMTFKLVLANYMTMIHISVLSTSWIKDYGRL